MDELEQSREAFREAMPVCLAPDWDSIMYGIVPDVPDAMARLQDMLPDEVEQSRALLRWYDAGSLGAWWYQFPSVHQKAARTLIREVSSQSLVATIDSYQLEDIQALVRYIIAYSPNLPFSDAHCEMLLKFGLQAKNDDRGYRLSYKSMYPTSLVKLISELSFDRKSTILPTISHNFGLSLLQYIAPREINKNIFVSPLSMVLSLVLLYIAAEGKTRHEIASLLDIPSIKTMDLNLDVLHFLIPFMNVSGLALHIANALWLNKNYRPNTDFAELSQTYHRAEVAVVDFSNPETPKHINKWVKDATKGLIQQIVSSNDFNPNMAAMLVNAVYFKAHWAHKFSKTETRNEPFYLINGTSKDVSMMKRTAFFDYAAFDEFEAIVLPYKDGTFRMEIYLPHEDSLLDAKALPNWMEQFHNLNIEDNPLHSEIEWYGRTIIREPYGTLHLPEFRTDYEIELSAVLMQMGLETLFDPDEAELSNLLSEEELPVWISDVIHKTFLKVDEEGTEAAAVTFGKIAATGPPPPPPEPIFDMVVNRPFFLLIRDSESGTLFFVGQIMEPM